MEGQIILTTHTKTQLVNEIALEVLMGIESLLSANLKKDAPPEFLTGKQVEQILSISTQTRYDWGHKGILQPYKIGSRTRYRREDVYNALRALETQKG